MSVLLDTHALIWWLFDDPKLSANARRWIAESEVIHVSAGSIFEIDDKRRQIEQKRAEGRPGRNSGLWGDVFLQMPRNLPEALPALGMELVDITPEVAWRAARLPFKHSDPWDRILVAHAVLLEVPLISCDRHLLEQARDTPIIW